MLAKLLPLDKHGGRPHTGCMPDPRNAIEAVTHPDPYAWHARMAAERPLCFDESLKLWVAAGAPVVDEALAHRGSRRRPLDTG